MFDAKQFIEQAKQKLKEQVGGGHAIIACSGGVDSTVTAVLMHEALGGKLHCVFVDTGYMRKDEGKDVSRVFKLAGVDVKLLDKKEKFYTALKGVEDPEKKRKIIGELFIRIFEEESKEVDAKFLGQGTLAPDWIESGAGVRDTIKSHHNVGGVPADIGLELVEPLRELYKDEVRKVGLALGIPKEACMRQPFPGPALAIRIIGEATPEKVKMVQEACAITEEEIEKAALAGEMELPWQYFAVLIPARTVGVLGDKRAYGYTIAVRAVQSIDGMTARYSEIPHTVLSRISDRITRDLKDHINRVVYDITSKPPSTIEWE